MLVISLRTKVRVSGSKILSVTFIEPKVKYKFYAAAHSVLLSTKVTVTKQISIITYNFSTQTKFR
jgi:hypothetical protein